MRRALLLLLLLGSAGCALSRAERPLAPSLHLIVEDARSASQLEECGFLDPILPYVVPLVPWIVLHDDPMPERSLAPELVQAVEDTGLFTQVLGPGDPWPERLAAPCTLRVALLEFGWSRWRTAYGIGIAGLLLQALGAPQDYESTTIALRATCTSSDGRVVCEGEGRDGEVGFTWIYEGSYGPERAAALRHAVRVALGDALAPLLEPDRGYFRVLL